MDEEPLLTQEEQPVVMSNEEINAELGTPSPQPLSETDVAQAPQFSADPLDPLSRVEQGIEGIKPEQMIGSSQMMTRSATLDETRRYKGIGAFEIIPKDNHVDTLRKNQSDPLAVEAFDSIYGAGAAARYLSLAKKEHIETLLRNRNDPLAVDAFNAMYGAGMANLYAILYSPKANLNERYQAAVQLTNIMNGVEEAPKKSVLGTIGESIFTGAANFVQQTARSIGALDKNSPSYRQDGVGISDYPITEAIVTNLTQFIAGRAALGALLPARDLTRLGSFFREMGLGAIVDAFAFAPEDPLVGDAAKDLAKALGIPEQDLTWLWSVNDFDTEWQKRGMRAVEGAALGAIIEPVLRGIAWGIKLARGQTKEAEKIAENIQPPGPPTTSYQQLELGLTQRPYTEQPSLPMDLPFERRLDVVPDSQLPPVPRETAGQMEERLMDKWGVDNQLRLDIPEPPTVPILRGDGQGELFPIPNQFPSRGASPEAPRKAADGVEAQAGRTDSPNAAPAVRASDDAVEAPPSKTATREETIEDALNPKSPEEKAVKGLIDEPQPRPANPIQQIIDQIPDLTFTRNELGQLVTGLTDTTFKAVVKAVEPFVEQAIQIADKNASDLVSFFNRSNTVDEVEKFAALMNAAVKQVTDEISIVRARIEAFEAVKNKAEAARVVKDELTPLLNLKDKLDRVDSPMATMAAQIMVRRLIEKRLVAAARIRVNPLRQAGVTDRQIGSMIADAVDSSGNKLNRVDQLVAQRDIAFKSGDLKLVDRLDKQIEKAIVEAEKAASKELDSTFNIIVKTINDITIPFMLSGFPTMIVNVVSPAVTYGIRNLGDIVGMTLRKGPVFAYNQQRAKLMGLQAGAEGQRKLLLNVIDAVLNERSKIYSSDGLAMQESGFIRAESYGLDSSTKVGTAVNLAGKSVRALTWPLALTDEFYGQVIARAEIGAEASFNFQTNVASRISDLKAQIKASTGAEKTALQKELKELQANPTIIVPVEQVEKRIRDGVEVTLTTQKDTPMTLKEFIEHRVGQAFDENGRLIDPRVSEEVAAIALRDSLTSNVGTFIEESFARYPLLRTLQPVLRIPVNSFIRGMEMIPVFTPFIRDPQSIYADLKGFNGGRRQIEAQGRVVVGSALAYLAWELASAGLITGEEPQNKWQRNNAQASNDTRGYNMKVGNSWFNFTGLDPVAMVFKIAANYHQMTRSYEMREDVMKKSNLEHFFIAVETFAAAARDIPTFELLKTVSDFMKQTEKMSDDPNAGKRAFEQLVTKQVSKTVPAMVRNVNQLIDPTRIEIAGGSLGEQIMRTFKAEFGFRDQVPRMYDILGEPLKVPRSTRAVFGMFAPLDVDKMDKNEYVRQSINRLEVITNRAFSMAPNPPGLKDIDLRDYKSNVGNNTMAETFFKAYGSIKDQDGMTVADRLYTLFRGAEVSPNAIGNYKEDGPLTKDVADTINRFKKMAWEYTKAVEGRPNTEFMTDVERIEVNKLKARDPRFDPVIPQEFPGFAQ